ncbi:MAG: alpha/beta hydrolase [Planctomycetes bacterium]|nr:alpha/beta hydrolase [Planctomycetota bacterium]
MSNQESLIFRPKAETCEDFKWAPYVIEEHSLDYEKGKAYGWMFRAPRSKNCILYFYGNSDSSASFAERIPWLSQLSDASFFILEYPGYGKNSGAASEASLNELMALWGAYFKQHFNYKPKELIFWGRSLGGSVAAMMSQHMECHGLILESPFISMVELASDKYPYLPISMLCTNTLPILEPAKHFQGKVAIIHSKDDTVVLPRHAQSFKEHLPENADFLSITGTHKKGYQGHGSDYKVFLQRIFPASFSKSLALGDNSSEK